MAVIVRLYRQFFLDVEEYGQWFEVRQQGLGRQFAQAVEKALDDIVARPLSHQFLWQPYRRVLIRRFRVVVPFELVGASAHVLGVVHGTRDRPRWLTSRVVDDE